MSASNRLCECCGQPKPNKLGFALDEGFFFKEGRRLGLSRQEYAFLEAVADAYPRPARLDYVIDRIWPNNDEPDNVLGSLGVLAHRIRNKTGVPLIGNYNGTYIIADRMPRRNDPGTRIPLSQTEKDRAQDLYDMGYPWSEIEALIGRPQQTLRHYVVVS